MDPLCPAGAAARVSRDVEVLTAPRCPPIDPLVRESDRLGAFARPALDVRPHTGPPRQGQRSLISRPADKPDARGRRVSASGKVPFHRRSRTRHGANSLTGDLAKPVQARRTVVDTGRSGEIRTHDPCLPKAVLYQAELHSDRAGRVTSPPGLLQGPHGPEASALPGRAGACLCAAKKSLRPAIGCAAQGSRNFLRARSPAERCKGRTR